MFGRRDAHECAIARLPQNARTIIEGRIRKDGPAVLREAAERMTRGDAPAIPLRPDAAQP